VQAASVRVFEESLRELGHIDGRDVVLGYRWARGAMDRLPGLADELVRLPADEVRTRDQPEDGEGARLAIPQGVLLRADEVIQ
jgi:hypothetical protein